MVVENNSGTICNSSEPGGSCPIDTSSTSSTDIIGILEDDSGILHQRLNPQSNQRPLNNLLPINRLNHPLNNPLNKPIRTLRRPLRSLLHRPSNNPSANPSGQPIQS